MTWLICIPFTHVSLNRSRTVKPELDDSGVSMDSDLSKSMDQLNGQNQRNSFSLTKHFLKVEDPPDEDDDIQVTATPMDSSTISFHLQWDTPYLSDREVW